MNHRVLRYAEDWEWHMLTFGAADAVRAASVRAKESHSDGGRKTEGQPAAGAPDLRSVKRELPDCADWLDACIDRREAQVTVTELPDREDALHGTLMLRLSDDDRDVCAFHYWLTNKRLVTFQMDLRFTLRLQQSPWSDKLERVRSAPEAFAVMLSAALEPFHEGLDAFERRIGLLEEAMSKRNRSALTELIFRRRHELLRWSHSYIGVKEAEGALAEAFANTLADRDSYKKLVLRLSRIEAVIGHYSNEIDTLISMDEALTTLRGNDIMKTLTIFTVLFMPATVAGALWGMNFSLVPWAKEPFGFAALCGIVAAATAAVYLWLWRKEIGRAHV